MYVYLRVNNHLYTVGFYKPNGEWEPESDHHSDAAAAARVHWLNGGDGPSQSYRGLDAEDRYHLAQAARR